MEISIMYNVLKKNYYNKLFKNMSILRKLMNTIN